jgi:hypothetical protein
VTDAIRRPEWHDCPAFNGAWDYLRTVACDPRRTDGEINGVIGLAREMADARVLKIHSAQLAVLEKKVDELEAEGGSITDVIDGKIPFPYTFIEVLGGDDLVRGVLISRDGGTVLTPFAREPLSREWLGGFSGRMVGPVANDGERVIAWPWLAARGGDDVAAERESMRHLCSDAAGVAAAMVTLLNCSNVETLDEPLPRQARRHAKRKNQKIALTVHLKRKKSKSVSRGGLVDWTHQFDVRGHFQHHPRGPVFENCKDPEKRMMRGGVEVVRVWVNPYIKGPADERYVVKSRDATRLDPIVPS